MLPLFLTFILSSTKNSHQSCFLLLFRISLLNALLCSSQRNAPLTPQSASLRKNQFMREINRLKAPLKPIRTSYLVEIRHELGSYTTLVRS